MDKRSIGVFIDESEYVKDIKPALDYVLGFIRTKYALSYLNLDIVHNYLPRWKLITDNLSTNVDDMFNDFVRDKKVYSQFSFYNENDIKDKISSINNSLEVLLEHINTQGIYAIFIGNLESNISVYDRLLKIHDNHTKMEYVDDVENKLNIYLINTNLN